MTGRDGAGFWVREKHEPPAIGLLLFESPSDPSGSVIVEHRFLCGVNDSRANWNAILQHDET